MFGEVLLHQFHSVFFFRQGQVGSGLDRQLLGTALFGGQNCGFYGFIDQGAAGFGGINGWSVVGKLFVDFGLDQGGNLIDIDAHAGAIEIILYGIDGIILLLGAVFEQARKSALFCRTHGNLDACLDDA